MKIERENRSIKTGTGKYQMKLLLEVEEVAVF